LPADPAALLPGVLDAVAKASTAILEVYASAHGVEYTADESPITRADRAAQEILARELAAAVVVVGAQRASGAYPPVPGLMSTDGGPELLPWWLLGLTPGDVAAVLHTTGFLTGATLSSTLLQSVTLAGNDPYVGAISRCGNGHARWLLVECAEHYLAPPKVSKELSRRQEHQPPQVRALSWKAQKRVSLLTFSVCIPQIRTFDLSKNVSRS
jgi:hypothetical protein